MDTARNYHRLALDCFKTAQRAHDPAIRDDMIRLGHLWARLADQVRHRPYGPQPQPDQDHAA
jgi:hypothetical protein